MESSFSDRLRELAMNCWETDGATRSARRRVILSFVMLVWCGGEVNAAKKEPLSFERDIVPILKNHCWSCHGLQGRKGGLDLRRRFTMLRGGDSGPAIVPGKPKDSLLMEVITDGLMPPAERTRLNAEEVNLFRRWILEGAAIGGKTEAPLPKKITETRRSDADARLHWAFQPVRPASFPQVADRNWLDTGVDAFILAQLEQRSWQPAAPADSSRLLRRLYFDLIGLPPTPEQIDIFTHDDSPDAYDRVVDQLLASPHFGEHWAQFWLDVVRFAETEGFEYDRHLPGAWRYRDYVIDAFNRDKPLDQFIREQIAGDEIAPGDVETQSAAILHRLGAVRRNAGNPEIALSRNEVLTERTNIIGEAFLGLTIGCARCHHHKLEPLSQRDYYHLQAYLAASQEYNLCLASAPEQAAWEERVATIDAELQQLKEQVAGANGETKLRLERKIAELSASKPPPLPTIPSIRNEQAKRTAIHVLRRGDWELKGVSVGPRPPSVLIPASRPELPRDFPHPRTKLAAWITSPANPLPARVMVNRLWQNYFGVGLVKTANDLGTHGARPSHPKLLDWLAHTLLSHEWRWKAVHRRVVLSSAYRQSSRTVQRAECSAKDPENRLLWRHSSRRLSAEEVRDTMLMVSGRINRKAFGPSVMLPVDEELVNLLYKPTQWQVTPELSEHYRRSVYLIAKRNLRLPFMETFDAPGLQASCARRETSIHARQALEMLNGELANRLAKSFAERLIDERERPESVVRQAFRLALGRAPTQQELTLSLAFLRDQPVEEFTLAIFNLNEFLHVP